MDTLAKFLNRAMHVALSPRTNPLTFVFGNEGGDIDSVVSAIYTALLLSSSLEAPTHVPVINFPRADLRLRGDVWSMLRDYGVTEECLLFEEHLNGTAAIAAPAGSCIAVPSSSSASATGGFYAPLIHHPKDAVIMTDHNVLRASQRQWGPRVVGIVDHHADEHMYDGQTCGGELSAAPFAASDAACPAIDGAHQQQQPFKRIEMVGSATSLVALLWREREEQQAAAIPALAASPTGAIPAPILLLSPIVQDTSNFKNKKNTPTDEAARDYIVEHIRRSLMQPSSSSSSSAPSVTANNGNGMTPKRTAAIVKIEEAFAGGSASAATNRLADHLEALKEDIRGLTAAETLRRDYKRFDLAGGHAVGISAILLKKKQCRKLYAEAPAESDGLDAEVPPAVGSDDDDDDDDEAGAAGAEEGAPKGYPTDAAHWLPTIAARMRNEGLDVYMNMYNKKGRELEVIYRAADAAKFEAVWGSFVAAHADSVGLVPKKKRFAAGNRAAEYVLPQSASAREDVGGLVIRQIVYRQQVTAVSRKNFTPFLVEHFKKHYAVGGSTKSDL